MVTHLSTSQVAAGTSWLTLTVYGAEFTTASKVLVNGLQEEVSPTTFVSSSELRVGIGAALLALPGELAVTVFTPSPGGGQSGPAYLQVIPAVESSVSCSRAPGAILFVNWGVSCTFTPGPGAGNVVWSLSGFTMDSQSATAIFAVAVASGPASIVAEWNDDVGSHSAEFDYIVVDGPRVDSIAPVSGPTSGGIVVTVMGTGFTNATAVTFGESPAESFTVINDSTITAISPPHSAGIVDITIAVGDQVSAASSGSAFTFVPPLPELRFVDPQGNFLSDPLLDFVSTGSRVRACTFDAAIGTPASLPVPIGLPELVFTSGGGHSSAEDPDPNVLDPIVYTGTSGNSAGATCVSWVSTNAGDQTLSIVYTPVGGDPVDVRWDSDGDGNGGLGPPSSPLRIGWAQLEKAVIGYNGNVYAGNDALNPVGQTVVSAGSPATGFWVGGYGSYIDETGQIHVSQVAAQALTGLSLAVVPSNGCALVFPDTIAVSENTLPYTLDLSGCPAGSQVDVTLIAEAPHPLGSGGAPSATAVLRLTIAGAVALTHPTTISAGGNHSLALDEDGELWLWGSDLSGQLPWPRPLRPHLYTFPAQLASLDGGGYYSMGMTATGDVWTWGYDAYGQMGDGPGGGAAPFNVPFQAPALAVSAGSSHSFALLADGTLWAWGVNDRGQLGLGYATPYPSDPLGVESPQLVALTDVVAIAAAEGGAHTLALKSDGTVWGWGEPTAILTSPPVGGGPFEPIVAPQQVPGLTGVTAIAAAGYRSLALKSDGTVWQWDAWGGLQQVQGLPVDIVAITAGPSSAHALTSTGEVYGWGNNHRGSVGDGTFDPRPTAVQLSLPGPVVQISDGGGDHSLALLADGRIFAWGANGAGVLGIGTEVDTPSPTQVLFGPSDTVTCSGEQWPTRYPFSISCSSDLAPGSGPVTWTAVGLTPGTQNGTSVSFATALPEDDPLPASWPVVIEASWTDPQGNPRTVTMPRTVESPASCSGGQTTSVFCSFVVGGTFGTWSATGFSPEYSENSWQEFTRQPFTSGTITATFAGRQQVFEFPWDAPPPPVKRVFLAWAGQRVILEHDWRTPPGDAADVEPNGSCPFAGPTPIRYVKGSGPGNFLPALGASIDGESDPMTAVVEVSAGSQQLPSQVPFDPQGACISRVLYESEDQGQVDIEAFPDPGVPQAPMVAFVVYYMKLESVALSLEAALAKPSVNATNGDFAPGNPWAPSSGAVTVTRNISTDLLVRGRVKGFFTNNNPSGRPGTSNLPPDRWVMPDDWALLAGGPADPADGSDAMGTAEQFRPYYDIMSAPNSGLACSGLEGLCMERPIGEDTVSEVPGPFVGPYSVLDIPGISSAALGNTLPFSVRETILRDGDIDMWDAPMPPALVSVDIRGAGYLRQVRKQDVYYLGDPDMQGPGQSFPNLFYRSNIPDSPFIPAVVAGGGYLWDSWGNDGPGGNGQGAHEFWTPVLVGVNAQGASDPTLTQDDLLELEGIAAAADDSTIARTLVVYSDNHGEFMVAANGKFKAASGSCEPSPVAGTSTITAVADYPDFRGKHFTVASNVATVTWIPDAVSIASLSPGTVVAGSENVELTLAGSGFVPGVSQVCLNGAPLPTTVNSANEASAVLPGPAATTTYLVRVANTTAGGGASNVLVLLGTVQPTSVSEIAVVTNDDPEETVTVSTPPPQPEAPPVITVETSAGTGTVAVAIYETNPGETPTFAIGSGGETGTFVDAYVSPTSTFASTIIVICDPIGGDVAYWWDGAAWSPASDQSFDANTGCITVTVTPDTSPDIADLSGTIFAAALGYAPVIQSVSATPELVPVGSAVTASVAFADRDLPQDAHTATWNWGDGSMSQGPAGTAATHQYLLPGVYTVSVSVTDSDGATASTSFRYVVVYDPGGGFVTGGGWIDSPAGAYAADPTLTGKATFGFVSQYKKGATVPTGKTEFQFQAGALNFKSTSYEWLVVAGAKAQFRGQGTINGQGDYAFFVTAIDGDSDGDKKPDKFRIRIWDRLIGGLVYDNQLNAPDDADPTTVLGGGSIVVHR